MNKHRHTEVYMKKFYNKNYFEGWYYKQVDHQCNHIISFIPSVSFSKKMSKAYLQVIFQKDDSLISDICEFELSDFSAVDEPFKVKVKDNSFSQEGIGINFKGKKLDIHGNIQFSPLKKLEYSFLQPNIMGFFSYLPFMQCKHGILSMNHKLSGSLHINQENISFDNGKGYIEKDWGSSFPKNYMWIQCNHFKNSDTSLFFSLAHIPLLAFSFQGFICNFLLNKKQYRFATYTGARVKTFKEKEEYTIEVSDKKYKLKLSAQAKESKILLAPKKGEMNTQIKEALSGKLKVELIDKSSNRTLYKDDSENASMEIVD